MWKIFLSQSIKNKQKNDSGFFTIEILVSLLISLMFVMVSLQSMVYATMIKVQAQERQRANQLIKDEIERVNNLAKAVNFADGDCDAVNYDAGLAKALWDDIQTYASPSSSSPPPIEYLIQRTQADGSINEAGRQFGLNRVHVSNFASTSPHRTLSIRYDVREWDGTQFTGDTIAETYLEVIPDVALSCP